MLATLGGAVGSAAGGAHISSAAVAAAPSRPPRWRCHSAADREAPLQLLVLAASAVVSLSGRRALLQMTA